MRRTIKKKNGSKRTSTRGELTPQTTNSFSSASTGAPVADMPSGGTSTIKNMFGRNSSSSPARTGSVGKVAAMLGTDPVDTLAAKVSRDVHEFIKQAKIAILMTGTPVTIGGTPHYMRLGSTRVVEYCAVSRIGEVPEALVAKTRIAIPSIIEVRSCYVENKASLASSPSMKSGRKSSASKIKTPATLPTITSTKITLVVKRQEGRDERVEQIEVDTLNDRACINWTETLMVLTGKDFVARATLEEISVFEMIETELALMDEDSDTRAVGLDLPPLPGPPEDFNFYFA